MPLLFCGPGGTPPVKPMGYGIWRRAVAVTAAGLLVVWCCCVLLLEWPSWCVGLGIGSEQGGV